MIETMINPAQINSEDKKDLRKILIGSLIALSLMLGALLADYITKRGVEGLAKDYRLFCEGDATPYCTNLNIDKPKN